MTNVKCIIASLAFLLISAGTAGATCPTFTTLTNGAIADADQVMGNFNYVIQCPNFTGKVGIGTASPNNFLEISGTSDTAYSPTQTASFVGERITNLSNSANTSALLLFSTANLGLSYIGGIDNNYGNASADLVFGTRRSGTLNERMRVTAGGNVGIGTTSPDYLLQIGSPSASGVVLKLENSAGACTHTPGTSSETIACSSDARLKRNITDAPSALSQLANMHIRAFNVRATGARGIGVIAQEMRKTHPTMVHRGPDGFYKVDEPNPWVLVKAIQELMSQNERLAATNASLNARLTTLLDQLTQTERRISALEARARR